MVHLFYCFLCSRMPVPCLYLNNNYPISFFVFCSVKILLFCDMISFILQILVNAFRQIKMKMKSFGSFLSSMSTTIIIMTWLNCCKLLWWFYFVDTKDIVFVQFCFLVYMNYLQLSFKLIMLKTWLIVYLGLRFLILYLL